MTAQPDLQAALALRLRIEEFTGWVHHGELNDDLDIVAPDATGLEHLYVRGQRYGWVQYDSATNSWVTNWRVFRKGGVVHQLQWLDPYAGDKCDHFRPSKNAAKHHVETKVFGPRTPRFQPGAVVARTFDRHQINDVKWEPGDGQYIYLIGNAWYAEKELVPAADQSGHEVSVDISTIKARILQLADSLEPHTEYEIIKQLLAVAESCDDEDDGPEWVRQPKQ